MEIMSLEMILLHSLHITPTLPLHPELGMEPRPHTCWTNSTTELHPNPSTHFLKGSSVFIFFYIFIMKKFKNIQKCRTNSVMNPHLPITQIQQLSRFFQLFINFLGCYNCRNIHLIFFFWLLLLEYNKANISLALHNSVYIP